jgi:hypothetical protein
MRYLRMLTNAIIGGGVASAFVCVLFLQLNPALPLGPARLAPILIVPWLFYGLHLVLLLYTLIVARQLVADEILSPGWISFRLLAWISACAAAAGSALMWANLTRFRAILDADAARRMGIGAVAASGCAAALIAIAVGKYAFGRRRGAAGATLFTVVLASSLLFPIAARGRARRPILGARPLDLSVGVNAAAESASRVVMILLDGGSLDFISPAAAEGRLPSIGKILDSGATLHLATLHPTAPGPVWTAVATGKLPPRNGVRSPAVYRAGDEADPVELLPDYCFSHALVHFGFLAEEPHSSAAVQARPLWSILGSLGVSAGVVNWPLTHPAQPIRGYMVGDRFFQLNAAVVADPQEPVVYPFEILSPARAAIEAGIAPTPTDEAVQRTAAVSREPPHPIPCEADRVYDRVAAALDRRHHTQFTAVRYQGLDSTGHYFLRYAMPRDFGDVSDQERQQFGSLLGQYYAFIDSVVGRAMATLGPDDLLVVVSGFGMEPLDFGKRLLERLIGNPELSGTHQRAPDGFLLAYGAAVEHGHFPRASVVDVTPTILYFLGLPVGRDMDGYARTDIFRRAFTEERPITFIPTYDR